MINNEQLNFYENKNLNIEQYLEIFNKLSDINTKFQNLINLGIRKKNVSINNGYSCFLLYKLSLTNQNSSISMFLKSNHINRNMSYTLKTLIELGFITLSADETDNRCKIISLTEKGLDIANTLKDLLNTHMSKFEPEFVKELISNLENVNNIFNVLEKDL